ncbi:MAG: hypothetical protein ACK559_17455, partial [bacterium]
HQSEPLIRFLLHRNRHPFRIVPADDHVHGSCCLTDRHSREISGNASIAPSGMLRCSDGVT